MPAYLDIHNLTVAYDDTPVLEGLSLAVRRGEFLVILGESGSGKTTLLNTIAGFIDILDGSITLDGDAITGLPPHRRRCAMVFQDYALFPHMTVSKNVMYGLTARNMNKTEAERRVREILETVRMNAFAGRLPNELSGGQQQRAALARAIVTHPKALLLDEPLSNLDANLRVILRRRIRNVFNETLSETGACALYVTHDRSDAFALADRIAIIHHGKIDALDDPKTLYYQPPTPFAATFLGHCNLLTLDSDHAAFDTNAVASDKNGDDSNRRITLFCRPEQVREGRGQPPDAITFDCEKTSVEFFGEYELVGLNVILPGNSAPPFNWKLFRANPSVPFNSRTIHVRRRDLSIWPAKSN